MNAQAVTPELRRWIIEQAQAGCRPEDVLAAMRNSGWAEDVAVAALEDTLRGVSTNGARPSNCRRRCRCPSQRWPARPASCGPTTAR